MVSSRPSRLEEDIRQDNKLIKYSVQEPGDAVWTPFGAAHCVLTVQTSVLFTWTLMAETDSAEERQRRVLFNRSGEGNRKEIINAGANKGKRKRQGWYRRKGSRKVAKTAPTTSTI